MRRRMLSANTRVEPARSADRASRTCTEPAHPQIEPTRSLNPRGPKRSRKRRLR